MVDQILLDGGRVTEDAAGMHESFKVSRGVIAYVAGAHFASFQEFFLEQLPVEIIGNVFEWLRISQYQQTTAPLSRTLVHFVRRNLYREVNVRQSHFLDFCDTVKRHDLHPIIHRLTINWDPDSDEEANWQPHQNRILSFFRSTTQITHLDVEFLASMSLLLLSPTFASTCLPKVNSLVLFSTPLDLAAKFRFRRQYSRLETLQIHLGGRVGGDATMEWLQESGSDGLELPIDRVKSLVLELEEDSNELNQLMASFNVVQDCTLVFECPCDVGNILEQLDPSHLQTLTLYSDDPFAPLDSTVLPFHQLQSLSLHGPVYTSALFPHLHCLAKLVSLTLSNCHDVELADLESILTGPTKIQSLKKLTVFEDDARLFFRGPSYLDEGHEFGLWSDGTGFYPCGWQLGDWMESFPREDVESFLELAREVGVEVGSHLQEALFIERQFEVEWLECERYSKTPEAIARAERERKREREELAIRRAEQGVSG